MQKELTARPGGAELHLALGLAEAGLGNKMQAITEGERAVALVPIAIDVITGPDYLVHLAQLYGAVGETDKAIEAINTTLAVPAGSSISIALLKLDPVWDPLRTDPRFQRFVADSEAVMQAKARP